MTQFQHRKPAMEKVIIELRTKRLRRTFDETNSKLIVEWLIAAEKRRPVILVGAGFSRCAKDQDTQDYVSLDRVPLWKDLVDKMARHLRVSSSHHDAPTMAEMYEESFGPSGLRDLLRDSLPDHALVPARAHEKLAAYDSEAVITTNCLDTLLEKVNPARGRWNRVVEDADLSGGIREASVDLIYFHGHRCMPSSWIITRTAYECVASTRPVVLARVRQVIAQHPLLILGFGMADPNFHNVYRQLSSDMRRAQPSGLMVQFDRISEAERRHWDRLGIRMVVPSEHEELKRHPAQADRFFAELLEELATSWTPDEEKVLNYVKEPDSLAERFRRFHQLAPHLWKGQVFGDRYGTGKDEAFRAWHDVMFSVCSQEEQKNAHAASQNALNQRFGNLPGKAMGTTQPESGPTRDRSGRDTTATVFKVLPEWCDRTSDTSWLLDGLLANQLRDTQQEIADHFELALNNGLYRSNRAEQGNIPWIPLTFWLASLNPNRSAGGLQVLGATCLRMADKYGDRHWRDMVVQTAGEQGLSFPEEASTTLSDSPEARGQRALLRHDFGGALKCYQEAAAIAFASGMVFEEWVWRHGELEALRGEHSALSRNSGERDKPESRCRDRIRRLEDTREVRDWQKMADERARDVLEYALRRRDDRVQYRARGGRGHRFSNAPNMAWRSFRDLETLAAPPCLLEEHIKPLLWERDFSIRGELGYRIVLGIKETGRWLSALVDVAGQDLDSQRERDAGIMGEFWQATKKMDTTPEKNNLLQVVPGIRYALRTEDTRRLTEMFSSLVPDDHGGGAQEDNKQRIDREALARAGALVAFFGAPAAARSFFGIMWKRASSFEKDEIARATYGLHWDEWGAEKPEDVVDWIRMVAKWSSERLAPSGTPRGFWRADELLAFAILRMLTEVAKSTPACLNELNAELRELTARFHEFPARGTYVWEMHRAGYLLERELSSGHTGEAMAALVRRWFEGKVGDSPDEMHERELRWSLIADAYEGNPCGGELQGILEMLWGQTDDAWTAIARRYKLNPHDAVPLARMLSTALIHLPTSRQLCAARLLGLLASAPSALPHVFPTLSREVWGEHWPTLMDRVTTSAGGGENLPSGYGSDTSGIPTEQQLGALDLWSRYVKEARTPEEGVRTLLVTLRSAALHALSDDRTLLANHAAYGLVAAMERASDAEESTLLSTALARIARDTRAAVRMAAAYAAGRLPRLAISEEIRQAAQVVESTISQDPNAMVRQQYEQGRTEAERKLKRRDESRDSEPQ